MQIVLDYVMANWPILAMILIFVLVAAVFVSAFIALPQTDKVSKIQKWLLGAVMKAEEELGRETGVRKLSKVYDMFLVRFPIVSKLIPFFVFKIAVDRALDEMKKLLSQNVPLAKSVYNSEPTAVVVENDFKEPVPVFAPEDTLPMMQPVLEKRVVLYPTVGVYVSPARGVIKSGELNQGDVINILEVKVDDERTVWGKIDDNKWIELAFTKEV